MADIVSINKIIDDNYISHDGTRLSEKLTDTGWILLDSDYENVYYRKIGNIVFLRGDVTPGGSQISIPLPWKIPYKYVFLLAGSTLYYTKAWINSGDDYISISAGTGTSTSAYALTVTFLTD